MNENFSTKMQSLNLSRLSSYFTNLLYMYFFLMSLKCNYSVHSHIFNESTIKKQNFLDSFKSHEKNNVQVVVQCRQLLDYSVLHCQVD